MSEVKNRAMFWNAVVAGILVAANLIVANIICDKVDLRWDLTEDKRYEIGESSQNILSQFEGTVAVKCYFSSNVPKRYNHVERIVAEKLAEYEELSGGKVVYEIVDPDAEGEEDSLQELKDMNVLPVPLEEREGASRRKIVESYLTMVFRYGDRKSVVNLFKDVAATLHVPGQFASQLEYFTTQAIRNVTHERRTIGVLAPIKLIPTRNRASTDQEKLKSQGLRSLKQWIATSHDVVVLDPVEVNRGTRIPSEIDVVMCYRPQNLSEAGLYILDQYIMAGGRVAFFIDEGKVSYDPKPKMTQIGNAQVQDFDLPTYESLPIDHNLTAFLDHLGVKIEHAFIEDKSSFEIQFIRSKEFARFNRQIYVKPIYEGAPYPSWPRIPTRDGDGQAVVDNQKSAEWPLLADSDDMLLCWAAPLTINRENLARHQGRAEVLLRSGPDSWQRSLKDNSFSPVPGEWSEPAAKSQQIAAVLVRGTFRSFFKGREVPKVKAPNGQEVDWDADFLKGRRDIMNEEGMVFVMGDADFVHDDMLRQIFGMFQMKNKSRAQDPEAMKLAYSAIRFAANAIDVLCYGEDAKSMFRLLNREVKSRELKDIKEGDPLMRKIINVNIYWVPGLVVALCGLVVFWRRFKTGAVSV